MEGVLYSTWGRKFRKYYGSIDDSSNYLTNFWIRDPPPKSCKLRFVVHRTPGVIYNKQVWFEQEDDERALKMLMENENRAIHELYEKIFNHSEVYAELKVQLLNLKKR